MCEQSALSLDGPFEGLAGMLAGSTGLEPAASGVTGRRSNQLNYDPDPCVVGGEGFEPPTAGV